MISFGTYLENPLVGVGYTTIQHLTETGRELDLPAWRWNLGGIPAVDRSDLPSQAMCQKHSTETLK